MCNILFYIMLIICHTVVTVSCKESKHKSQADRDYIVNNEDENSLEIIDFGNPPIPAQYSGMSSSYRTALETFKAKYAAEKSAENQTKRDGSWAKAFDDMLNEYVTKRPTMRSLVEQELDPFSQYRSGKRGSKRKKKDPAGSENMPSKEELDVTYKYEVLPPPDNSPVKLSFPATPAAQGEEHLSRHTPLPLYCDACRAIAYQLHLALDKFHRQVTRRPPTESEVYHLVGLACEPERFRQYGMLETAGGRHISGPGCNASEARGGVKHSRGPWPRRLAERCEEVTEDVGEPAILRAWLDVDRDPERLKVFLCDGEPPRDYCRRFGRHDWAPEDESASGGDDESKDEL